MRIQPIASFIGQDPGFGDIGQAGMRNAALGAINQFKNESETTGIGFQAGGMITDAQAMADAQVAAAGSDAQATAAQGAASAVKGFAGAIPGLFSGGGGGGFNASPLGGMNPSGSSGDFSFTSEFSKSVPFEFNRDMPSFGATRFAGGIFS